MTSKYAHKLTPEEVEQLFIKLNDGDKVEDLKSLYEDSSIILSGTIQKWDPLTKEWWSSNESCALSDFGVSFNKYAPFKNREYRT